MNNNESKNNDHLKYRLLAEVSLNAAEGMAVEQILNSALENALEVIGLVTGSVRVFDDSGKIKISHIAGRDEFAEMMRQMEEKLLSMLRDDFSVKSLFLTFEKDGTYSLFSYPLVLDGEVCGTISGIAPGEKNLALEEEFIKTVSAILSLVLSRGKAVSGVSDEDLMKARAEAVVETAVAINHEVNNPLTAVLGNIQLLLLNTDEFSPETRNKLKSVEESAMKIKEVTQNLMRIIEPSVIEYTTGLKMVDLEKSIKKPEEEKDTENTDK